MKKIIALLMAVLLVVSVFAGCQQKDAADETQKDTITAEKTTDQAEVTTETPPEKITLKFWAYSRWKGTFGDEANGENGDWHKYLAKEYMKLHPNVTIETEDLAFTGGNEKVTVAILAGSPPNVIEDSTNRLFSMVSMDAVMPLDDIVTQDQLDSYNEGVWEGAMYKDGKHYLYPIGSTVVPYAVNKTMFEKAGALDLLPDENDRTWTYDEFKTALKAVSDPANGVYGIGLYAGSTEGDSGNNSLLWGKTNNLLFDAKGENFIMNSPGNIGALEFMVSLIEEGLAVPGAETLTRADCLELFNQQKTAVQMHHPTAAFSSNIIDGIPFEQYMVYPPTDPGIDPKMVYYVIGNAVFKTDDEVVKKWSLDFLGFLSQKDYCENFEKNTKYLPVYKETEANALFAGANYVQGFVDAIKYAVDPGHNVPGYLETRDFLCAALQAAYTGAKTPKQALDDYAKQAQEIIDKYK